MTAIPAPWNGITIPEPRAISGPEIRVCRLLRPHELAADLPAFVVRRVEVYVRPPGLEIGDLCIGERRRPFDRACRTAAERHEDTCIRPSGGGTVDMTGRRGTAESRIGDRPGQRLRGSVQPRRRGALARSVDRRDLAGAAEIRLEVDLGGLRPSPSQE